MLKYFMTATALKAFSVSPQTRKGYRYLGNRVGQKKRIQDGISPQYMERAKNMLAWCSQYAILQPGFRLLEIGTGWVHWEATILRLFYDVDITLFDIWDNRYFTAYKYYCQQLAGIIETEIEVEPDRREQIHSLLAQVQQASTFDEIYAILNFTYKVNPRGTLDVFDDESFDLIFSSNVLEHVAKAILPEFTKDFYRILRGGGYSIHQIDLGDHLSYYDPRARAKNYLRYDDGTWRRFFENDVQYFNRVQKPTWMELFDASGLKLVTMESVDVDLKALPIAQNYQTINTQDLCCWTLRVVHTRPRL